MSLKVKIIQAGKPTYWYADKIGEVFEVEGPIMTPPFNDSRPVFEVIRKNICHARHFIDVTDCKIIEEE